MKTRGRPSSINERAVKTVDWLKGWQEGEMKGRDFEVMKRDMSEVRYR